MEKAAGQYRTFDRATWSAMGPANGTDITPAEIERVRSLNDKLSIDDVRDVYMPLVRYLRMRRDNYLHTEQAKANFLGTDDRVAPFIIGISGSVAVGKSTSARLLQLLMNRVMPDLKTQMLTTDGFLYPNAELERRGIMARKGFPESYDMHALLQFLIDIKLGRAAQAPVYSHEEYDVVPGQFTTVDQQDIVIVEGINVLQTGGDEPSFTPTSLICPSTLTPLRMILRVGTRSVSTSYSVWPRTTRMITTIVTRTAIHSGRRTCATGRGTRSTCRTWRSTSCRPGRGRTSSCTSAQTTRLIRSRSADSR
nr:type I pantothenate kinase [Lacticaseibacillus thailandensis]